MKQFAAVVTMLFAASLVNAGQLLIFSDVAFTDSTITDTVPRVANLYVIHTAHDGATASRFATRASAGFTGVWLGETSPYLAIGNSQTDISIGYGACLFPPPTLVLTMTYQLFGTSQPCSGLSIVPPAGFPVAICFEGGGCFSDLPCQKTGTLRVHCLVATEPTTWGKVKALYRN